MTMYAQTCRIHENTEQQISNAIISGFIGQLQGWWDNCVDEPTKATILQAKKLIKVKGSSQVREDRYADDFVDTLLAAIVINFISRMSIVQDRA